MPKIIKDGKIADDGWQIITIDHDISALPDGDIIIPVSCWHNEKDNLLTRRSELGIWLDSHEEPETICDDLNHFAVIAINFPKFTDGRGYSYAQLLRSRYGYSGELRAIGDILQDQLFYLHRCGFNAFSLREDKNIEVALTSLNDFSETYQTATDEREPIFRRHQR